MAVLHTRSGRGDVLHMSYDGIFRNQKPIQTISTLPTDARNVRSGGTKHFLLFSLGARQQGGILGMTLPTGFDFAEHQHAVERIEGDDVDFITTNADIPAADVVPLLAQEPCGNLFTPIPHAQVGRRRFLDDGKRGKMASQKRKMRFCTERFLPALALGRVYDGTLIPCSPSSRP